MRRLAPFLPMIALSTLMATIYAATTLRGGTPPEVGPIAVAPSLFLWAWMLRDARTRRCVPCHEFGFLSGIYFPAAFLWYLFWTRGWKGFGLLAAFFGLLIFPGIVAVIVGLIAHRG